MIELKDMSCPYCGAALIGITEKIWRCNSCGRDTLVNTYPSRPDYEGSIGDTVVENYIRYTITSVAAREVAVSECDPGLSGDITVPTYVTFNKHVYTVVAVQKGAFRDCRRITNLILPGTIKSIDALAFSGFAFPESFTLPAGLEHIGSYSFANSTGLKRVEFKSPLSAIGEGSFNECLDLESIYIGDSIRTIEPFAFYRCSRLKTVDYDRGNDPDFSSDKFLGESITAALPDTLENVGKAAFVKTPIMVFYVSNNTLVDKTGSSLPGFLSKELFKGDLNENKPGPDSTNSDVKSQIANESVEKSEDASQQPKKKGLFGFLKR